MYVSLVVEPGANETPSVTVNVCVSSMAELLTDSRSVLVATIPLRVVDAKDVVCPLLLYVPPLM